MEVDAAPEAGKEDVVASSAEEAGEDASVAAAGAGSDAEEGAARASSDLEAAAGEGAAADFAVADSTPRRRPAPA